MATGNLALEEMLWPFAIRVEDRGLLQACLLDGEAGERAWAHFLAARGDIPRALREDYAARELLPLLHHTRTRAGSDLGAAAPVLRASVVTEHLRWTEYRRICRSVLQALSAARVPFIVGPGAALGESVYPDPTLRHAHTIPLIVRAADRTRAAEAIAASNDFCPANGPPDERAPLVVRHVSGLPVSLQRGPDWLPVFPVPTDRLWTRCEPAVIAGVPVRVLDPALTLAAIYGEQASRGQRRLQWAADAWHVIHTRRDVDWQAFVDVARTAHLALPLLVQCSALASGLAAPVPAGVVDDLRAAARERPTREAAVYAARRAAGGARALARRMPSWRARSAVLQALLLPSATTLDALEPDRPTLPLTAYYAVRALRYATTRLRRR
jgi:hypothetical protein